MASVKVLVAVLMAWPQLGMQHRGDEDSARMGLRVGRDTDKQVKSMEQHEGRNVLEKCLCMKPSRTMCL